ncbi:MAG: hypothetical protein JNK68_02290 [Betaproteobacteria bacterium]|nr:hypothetical protein [Betaproteobacteria bacterium]
MIDFERLIGQFLISAGCPKGPGNWVCDRIGDWHLARQAALPVIRLVDGQNRPFGWLLGYPVSDAGILLNDGEEFRIPELSLSSDSALEAFIYSFGGRFASVLLGACPRIFLDPFASLSAVYSAHQRIVASTESLIPYDSVTRDRVELALEIGIPHTEGMYPLDMTFRHGIERILPNHYLDLREWRTVRHWPKQPSQPLPAEDAVDEIASLVKRNIGAVVAAVPTYLKLTAGWDSRMLLACAREWAPRLELFTAEIGDAGAATDCDTARRIAKRFGLKHHVLRRENAREEDLEEWMFRISYSTSERRGWQAVTMYKRLPGGHAVLAGNAGEVARAYYWTDSDTESGPITPARLLAYCGCPVDEATTQRARDWLDGVPTDNALEILDLFMIEQDMGCWASVIQYAECDPGFAIFPLAHRRIVERMLALPAPYRRAGRLPRDIIVREWPSLLDWPVNRPVGMTRYVFRAKKAIRKAKLLLDEHAAALSKRRGLVSR